MEVIANVFLKPYCVLRTVPGSDEDTAMNKDKMLDIMELAYA